MMDHIQINDIIGARCLQNKIENQKIKKFTMMHLT